jgi:hypothetical protein
MLLDNFSKLKNWRSIMILNRPQCDVSPAIQISSAMPPALFPPIHSLALWPHHTFHLSILQKANTWQNPGRCKKRTNDALHNNHWVTTDLFGDNDGQLTTGMLPFTFQQGQANRPGSHLFAVMSTEPISKPSDSSILMARNSSLVSLAT